MTIVTTKNKTLTIMIITAIILLAAAVLVFTIIRKKQSPPDPTLFSDVSISQSINEYIKSNPGILNRATEKPIYIDPNDIKHYREGWLTATITFLDEDPRGQNRSWFCIIELGSSGPVVKFFAQPHGPIDQSQLPENAPQSLIKDLSS